MWTANLWHGRSRRLLWRKTLTVDATVTFFLIPQGVVLLAMPGRQRPVSSIRAGIAKAPPLPRIGAGCDTGSRERPAERKREWVGQRLGMVTL